MANASFTRDEVILALDVLLQAEGSPLTAHSDSIKELCSLLQELPIHPRENRRADFRNETGVNRQIGLYKTSCRTGKRDPNVGELFFAVAQEFEDNTERLHSIAEAIRRSFSCYDSTFGSPSEEEGFPEGILLGHLHRIIEKRDGKKFAVKDRCLICQLEPELLYQPCGVLLEHHLTVDPVLMDSSKRYREADFITVCPNCHAALHRYRPWLNRDSCASLLR